VLNAELNSALNGDSFKGIIEQNRELGQEYWVFDPFQPVMLADIRS
jgi:hypothetical protein